MRAVNYVNRCPGCGKRVHAPTPESLQRQEARHVRNCNVLRPVLRAHLEAVQAEEFTAAISPSPGGESA